MSGNTEYVLILKELRESMSALVEGFYDAKKEREKEKLKIDISQPFSILNFPSQGLYYPDKKKSVLIKYLTAVEEHVLTDSFLVESGRGIELVLDNLIMDDLDVRELLTGDFQALLIFLRSTAYGDNVEIAPTCPHCNKEAENGFKLSELEFKEQKTLPNKNGKYCIEIEEINLTFILSPMTFEKELEKSKSDDEDDYFTFKDSDGTVKIKKEKTLSLAYNIESINGNSNKDLIKKVVRKISKKHIDLLLEFIKENESGIQDYIELNCPYCGEDFRQATAMGYDFISLPYEYKETVLEEIFLITYYGKGITYQDAMQLPVFQRKWHIRRIKEELDKKSKAEKTAYNNAKGKKGKF